MTPAQLPLPQNKMGREERAGSGSLKGVDHKIKGFWFLLFLRYGPNRRKRYATVSV